MLADILKGADKPRVTAQTIADISPDILMLTAFDWDHDGVALGALAELAGGYPHQLTLRPNSGAPTGLDLDRDGRLGGPGDRQGFGSFHGQGGMALLSRHPLTLVADHTDALWSAQPGALLFDGITDAERAALRLFSVGLWEVDVAGLRLLALSANPPVFDGPEDRNGRRNADQLGYAQRLVEAHSGPLVLLGNLNLDPVDGEGRKPAIRALLDHPRLQDPAPGSAGGATQATPGHRGDPALDTADWPDPEPGNLRTTYILPSRGLDVAASGVHWPAPGEPGHDALADGSRSRLVWVDLTR